MKKIIKYFLLIISSCFIFTNTVYAKSDAAISVNTNESITKDKTFEVTVKVTSNNNITKYGYTLNYDSDIVELSSGKASYEWYDKPSKSLTKTFTFKAKKTGKSLITIKNYSVYVDEQILKDSNINISGKTVTVKESDKDKKNNCLKNLKVDGGTLSPKFNKDTLEYTVTFKKSIDEVNITAEPESESSKVEGDGTVKVEAGANKVDIDVTSSNGSVKTYTLNIEVKDKNPIAIKVGNKEYTLVKSTTTMENMCPTGFELDTVLINDIDIPSCYNDTADIILVGLNNENNIDLFMYDSDKDSYKEYNEIVGDKLSLLIMLPEDKLIPDDYEKTSIKINNIKVNAYTNGNDKYYLIYAMNINTGKKSWYKYEISENTFQKYYSLEVEDKDDIIILVLSFILVISLIFNIVFLSKKKKK